MEEGAADFRKEKMILVQSMNPELQYAADLGIPGEQGRRYNLTNDYHMVDLTRNQIYLHCAPPLFEFAPSTTMVALDHSVYLFGGLYDDLLQSEGLKHLQTQSPNSNKKFYFGASHFHFDLDHPSQGGKGEEVWTPAPVPAKHDWFPKCTSLFGKIYAFGRSNLAPEVLDPSVGLWKPMEATLPLEFDGCKLSSYTLPDPSNHRILMHLYGGQLSSPSLYAFTPHSSGGSATWKCIATDFQCWTQMAVVVDDVILLHSHKFTSILRAFDLAKGTWLKVCWSSPFDDGVDLNDRRIAFDALLSLGDRILCLALSSSIDPSDHKQCITEIEILFPKFRMERSGETINLVPLSYRTYFLPATSMVQKFLSV